MDFSFTHYTLIMLSAAVVCLLIGYFAWRRPNITSVRLITLIMMVFISEWLIASALGYATTVPGYKIIWAKIEYIGVVSVPVLVLIFAVDYSSLSRYLTVRNLLLISLVPAVTLLFAWTNELHHLIWASYIPYSENGLMLSSKTYGIGFWIFWVYSYGLLLAAIVLITRSALISSRYFYGQVWILIFGIFLPWLGNILYILKIDPLGNLDLTPLSFASTGILLSLGIVHWRLFDIKPTANKFLIENMADGLILLNIQNRIIDINPAALRLFNKNVSLIIGKESSELLPADLFPPEWCNSSNNDQSQFKLFKNGVESIYQVSCTSFTDKTGNILGKIIILHDTTELTRMHETLAATERGLLNQKLSDSEGKYRDLYQNAPIAYYSIGTDGQIKEFNKAALSLFGYSETEMTGKPRLELYAPECKTKAEMLFEKFRVGYSVEDEEMVYQKKDGTKVYGLLSASTLLDDKGKVIISRSVVKDVTERKLAENKLKDIYRRLTETLDGITQSLSMAVELRDPYTAGHQKRVAILSQAIAIDMGLSSERSNQIYIAGLIHDMGKISIPTDILSRPGTLSNIEIQIIRCHPQSGYDILKNIDFPYPLADWVLEHHERIDGSGYPSGLRGDKISLEAKIIAVADVVEAMSSHRPYRPAIGIDKALEEIRQNKNILYDGQVVDACLAIFTEKGFKF